MFEKHKLSDKDVLGIKIFSTLVVLLIIFSGIISYLYISKVEVNGKTLCKINEMYESQNILLIDTTDKLSEFQADFLSKSIRKLIEDSNVYDRFTIYSIDSNRRGLSKPLFDMCNPGDGSHMNPIYENPDLARRRYDKEFMSKLFEFIDQLKLTESQDTSPIFESISDMFSMWVVDKNAKKHSMYFYSDLLQNTDKISAYKGDKLPNSHACLGLATLDEIHIKVLLRTGSAGNLQTTKLRQQWAQYLYNCLSENGIIEFEDMRY